MYHPQSTHGRAGRMAAAVCATLALCLFCAGAAPAQFAPLPLFVTARAGRSHPDLQAEAVARVRAALAAQGRPVLAVWTGKEAGTASPAPAMAGVGLVVEVAVTPLEERREQGRYRVRDRLQLLLLDPDPGEILWAGSEEREAVAFAGLAVAHRAALKALLRAEAGAPLAGLRGRLEAWDRKEQENGRTLVLVFRGPAGLAERFGEALGRAEGVVGASVRPKAATAGGAERRWELRYRGEAGRLAAVLLRVLPKGVLAELSVKPRRVEFRVAASQPPAGEEPKTVLLETLSRWGEELAQVLGPLFPGEPAGLSVRGAGSLRVALRGALARELARSGIPLAPAGSPPLRVQAALRERAGGLSLELRAAREGLQWLERRLVLPPSLARPLRALLGG